MEKRMPNTGKTVREWAEEMGLARGDIIVTSEGKYEIEQILQFNFNLYVHTVEGEMRTVFDLDRQCAFYAQA